MKLLADPTWHFMRSIDIWIHICDKSQIHYEDDKGLLPIQNILSQQRWRLKPTLLKSIKQQHTCVHSNDRQKQRVQHHEEEDSSDYNNVLFRMSLIIFEFHRGLDQKWNDNEVDEDDDQAFEEV